MQGRKSTAALFISTATLAFANDSLFLKSQNYKIYDDSLYSTFSQKEQNLNNRPMIGVLSQPLTSSQQSDPRFAGYTSFIQGTYISYIESAGARAVPLLYHGDWQETVEKLDHLNGILYCGGGSEGDYTTFGKQIFDIIKQKNDEGQHYPIWGTCLGFQDLGMFIGGEDVLTPHVVQCESPLIEYLVDPLTTKMFSPLGEKAHIYESYNMLLNGHNWGISPSMFETNEDLGKFFKPTSISYDEDGEQFVTTMEAFDYPFFGSQFHPERPVSTFYTGCETIHTETAIAYNRYFADFFVYEAKQNFNSYKSFEEEQSYVVQNFDVIVTTGSGGNTFVFK